MGWDGAGGRVRRAGIGVGLEKVVDWRAWPHTPRHLSCDNLVARLEPKVELVARQHGQIAHNLTQGKRDEDGNELRRVDVDQQRGLYMCMLDLEHALNLLHRAALARHAQPCAVHLCDGGRAKRWPPVECDRLPPVTAELARQETLDGGEIVRGHRILQLGQLHPVDLGQSRRHRCRLGQLHPEAAECGDSIVDEARISAARELPHRLLRRR
eukprot:scaffold62381_cov24-Tisochrysis_lutea.AAC.2